MSDQACVFTYIPNNQRETDKILNSKNSNLLIIDKAVYFNGNFYIKQAAIRKITNTKVKDFHGAIKNLEPEYYIKCNDPLILDFKNAKNAFSYMVNLQGCLKIIERSQSDNYKNGKSQARKNLISYFDELEQKRQAFNNKISQDINLKLTPHEMDALKKGLQLSIDVLEVYEKSELGNNYYDTFSTLKGIEKKLLNLTMEV